MAGSQQHQEKKVKNYLLLILLLLFVVTVFAVTIIKLSPAFKQAVAETRSDEEK